MEDVVAKPDARGFFLKNYLHAIILLLLSVIWFFAVAAGAAKVDAWLAGGPFLICVAYAAFAIVHSYLYCQVTVLTADKNGLTFKTGIINHLRKKVAVHNITDTAVDRPLYDRIIGVSTIMVSTSGSTGYEIELGAVPAPVAREFHNELYKIITHVRKEFGSRHAEPEGEKKEKSGFSAIRGPVESFFKWKK